MIGFLIKKAFFDMWDNMLGIIMLNLGFILLTAGMLYLPTLLSFNTALSIFSLAVGILLFNIYAGAASHAVGEFADYKSISFKEFFALFRQTYKSSLALGILTAIEVVILLVAFPFYAQLGGFLGLAAMALIFWITVIWTLASQYYFGIRKRLDTDIKKIFKKCFIIFFDNTGFSVFLGLVSLLIIVLSAVTAFLLPGIASLLLWHQVALKLRLYKYDYLEENPEADKKKIPWTALLLDDKDRVGPRTLRGMIFPWKE